MILYSRLTRKGLIVIIFIVIFYIAFSIYSDVNQLVKYLEKIQFYFIIPILLSFTISLFIKSIRQHYFLSRLGISIPFKQNIIIYLAGLSMFITPGAMGELIKSHFLFRNHNEPISKTAPLVIVERYHDALSLFSILIILDSFSNIPFITIPIIAVGTFLLSCMIIVQKRGIFHILQDKLSRIKFLKVFEKNTAEFNNSLFLLCNKKNLVYAWVISLGAVFFDALGIFFCFQAFGLNLNFIITTIVGFSSFLFGAFSFLPSGIGVTEISFVKLLSYFGLDLSIATALILFIRLFYDVYITLIGSIATRFVLMRNNSKDSNR